MKATITKFYTYDQNNSGGHLELDEQSGIGYYVIIEATSADEANKKAEAIGLYFDGTGDCRCCGDRWHEVDNSDGEITPKIYDRDVFDKDFNIQYVFIHYLNKPFELVK